MFLIMQMMIGSYLYRKVGERHADTIVQDDAFVGGINLLQWYGTDRKVEQE